MGALKKVGIGILIVFAAIIVLGVIGALTGQTTPTGRVVEIQPTGQNITEQRPERQTTQSVCIPNWQCEEWGKCSSYGTQSRACWDSNNCKNESSRPQSTRSCVNIVGDTIENSGLKITLNSIRTEYHIGTYYTYLNQYQNEAKGGYKYYIVSITVENSGSDSNYVSPLALTLLDGNKNQYEYSPATYYLTNSFESKDLLTDAKNSGEVAFEVPESATSLKLYYEIDSYNDIYAIWDLSNVNVSAPSAKECGDTGQVCCDNQCSRENICSGGVCVACGKDNQPPCSDGCYYGYELIRGRCKKECSYNQIRVNEICQDCGRDNQIPCSDGCDYGYELISGKCISECNYGQIRINGVCTDCGGLNEPCCSDSKCDYSKVCKNSVCVNCGDEAGQPCCPGEYKCLSFPTTTCVNDICQYCGRTGEICCEGNECNSGQICKNGVCEECGSTGQQCCGPENYYTCFIGSCENGICVYP